MVLQYLSIRYSILGLLVSSKNILGFDNIEVYISTARPWSIFGSAGK
jgi:hypothetical protein